MGKFVDIKNNNGLYTGKRDAQAAPYKIKGSITKIVFFITNKNTDPETGKYNRLGKHVKRK